MGLCHTSGRLVDTATHPIRIRSPRASFYEQSSEDIWRAVCACIRRCLLSTGVRTDDIGTVGFDATCSLVVLDAQDAPLAVSEATSTDADDEKDIFNVVMWMDHRASEQTERINATKHSALASVGSRISVEMDPPKLLWLKEHMYERCYARAASFYSLPDFLVHKFTGGSGVRSSCCVTCKWLYSMCENKHEWDKSFWSEIGLGELTENACAKVKFETYTNIVKNALNNY